MSVNHSVIQGGLTVCTLDERPGLGILVELIDLKVTWKKNCECKSFCNSRWPHGVHAGREAWARDLAPTYSTGAFCILNVEI